MFEDEEASAQPLMPPSAAGQRGNNEQEAEAALIVTAVKPLASIYRTRQMLTCLRVDLQDRHCQRVLGSEDDSHDLPCPVLHCCCLVLHC